MQSNGQELVEVDSQTYKTETLNTMLLPNLRRICQKQESIGLRIESTYHLENLVMEDEATSSTEQHFDNTETIMVQSSLQTQGLSRRNSE